MLGKQKNTVFKFSAIMVVLLFFLLVEGVFRLIFSGEKYSNSLNLGAFNIIGQERKDGKDYFFLSEKNGYKNQKILYKKEKEPGTYRIFCIGESASAGWPHPASESFSVYLNKILQAVYPDKKIEIINCSAHGFASYRNSRVLDELIPFSPDAVIFWMGNNEFLEKVNFKESPIASSLSKLASHSRMVRVLSEKFLQPEGKEKLDVAESMWKKVKKESLELRSEPQLFAKVKERYYSTVNGMVEKTIKNNISVILLTVPSNIRDWEPNVSFLGISKPDSLKWWSNYKEGRKALMNNDFHVSGTWLEKACSTAPLNAESYFYMGKAYLGGNDSINALTAFRAARDLDYNPFRAIGDFNSALREIAGQHPGVTLIDIENLMNNYAAGGIPGFDIFLDYVHPTKKGNMLIAHEISKNLVSKKIIGQEPVGKTLTLTDVRALLETDYNENRDYNLQVTKFSLFCLTHQYQTAIAQGNWLAKNLPKSVFQSEQKSRIRNMIFEAIEAFGDFEKAEKESFSGDNFLSQGTPAKQKLDAFYAKYFPYGTF